MCVFCVYLCVCGCFFHHWPVEYESGVIELAKQAVLQAGGAGNCRKKRADRGSVAEATALV